MDSVGRTDASVRWPSGKTLHARTSHRDGGQSGSDVRLIRQWAWYLLSMALVVLVAFSLYAPDVDPALLAATAPFAAAVVLIAFIWGRGAAVAGTLGSIIVFNYLFMPPAGKYSTPSLEEGLLLVGLLGVAFVLGTWRDRTLRVERAFRMLEESERLHKILLDAVSHDLKTPLTSLMGSLNTLLTDGPHLDPADRQELLTVACDQATRLNRLATGVLELTTLDAGAIRLRQEATAMEDILEDAMAELRGVLAPRRCRVVIAPGVPSVWVDPLLMSHAVTNVLDNAAKFSEPDTPINIEVHPDAAGVLLSTMDRGIGVPAADLTRIFEKFYRVGNAATLRANGSGLGLAIARGIVEAHEGQIWAEQRPGGGTIVRIRLPARAS